MRAEEATNSFVSQIPSSESLAIDGMNLRIRVEGTDPLDVANHQHFLRQNVRKIGKGRGGFVIRLSAPRVVAMFHIIPGEKWLQAKRFGITSAQAGGSTDHQGPPRTTRAGHKPMALAHAPTLDEAPWSFTTETGKNASL